MTDRSTPGADVRDGAEQTSRDVPPGHTGGVSRRTVLSGLGAVGIVGLGASTLWLGGQSPGAQDDAPLGTISGGGTSAATGSQPVTEYPVEDRGPAVELAGGTLTDDTIDLADLRGELVVVNVWGSWCGPCRIEAPVLARLSTQYEDSGVSFVGVDVKDNRAAALAFEAQYGITYPSIEDPDGRAVLALSQYVPASAVPVTLVLDRSGAVAARILGAVQEATLRAILETLLAEPG